MKWSFTIANVAGSKVRVHVTFLILLAWIGLGFYRSGGMEAAVGGLLFFITLFGCVLLHEFGHAIAARAFGIRTPTITLLPFGGLASIERIPKKPLQEIIIAIAGPLVNVVIVAFLWVAGFGSDWRVAPDLQAPLPVGQLLLRVNIMLVAFNMLPVFPMDGGRVFRALLAMVFPWVKATEIAALVGQSLAVCGGLLALSSGQPFLLIIAVFIFFAAGGEATAARTDGLLAGFTATDAAESEFHTVRLDERLAVAVEHLVNSSQHNYPVVDADGECVGVLTQSALLSHLAKSGPDSEIGSVMSRGFPRLQPGMPAVEALRAVQRAGLPAAPVFSRHGELTHWFTVDNLTDVILTQSALNRFAPQGGNPSEPQ